MKYFVIGTVLFLVSLVWGLLNVVEGHAECAMTSLDGPTERPRFNSAVKSVGSVATCTGLPDSFPTSAENL
jgi:hypothetical protein